jgi:hypothetical protein
VFDDALALLALSAAGESIDPAALEWLAGAQCGDAGWQFDGPPAPGDNLHCKGDASDFTTSDTNTTSVAFQALLSAGAAPERDPFGYLRAARDETKGGWRYSHQRRIGGSSVFTDANSTALVLQAYAAADRRVPTGARRALGSLQYRRCGKVGGAFAFTWARRDGRLRRSPSLDEARAGGPSTVGATIGAVPGLLLRPFPLRSHPVTRAAPARRPCDA